MDKAKYMEWTNIYFYIFPICDNVYHDVLYIDANT